MQSYNQEESIDYDETFAPAVRIKAIQMLIIFASDMDSKLYQMNVKSEFLMVSEGRGDCLLTSRVLKSWVF